MKRLLWLLFALPLIAQGYPIPPVTLWELTERAELIVVAKVARLHGGVPSSGSIEAARPLGSPGALMLADDGEEEDFARLEVIETLKGTAPSPLDVVTEAGLICPAPGHFAVGKRVLAFLYKDERDGQWNVVGLSYGTLYPDDSELPVFRERIAEALALQRRGGVSAEEKTAWLMRAATRKATRWHGLYGLLTEGERMRTYFRGEAPPLPEAQVKEIAESFIAEPSTVTMVARELDTYREPRFEAALVAAVDRLLEEDDGYWAYGAIRTMIERFGGDADKLTAGLEKQDFRYDIGELKAAWTKAREELGMPDGTKPTPARVGPGMPPY